MKKSLRKLIPAFVMMVVTMALLGTSTFAWFSMNNKVTVSGMEVTTKVGSSLQITADTLDSTAKKADNLFASGLNQATATGLLEPVSTINGTSFWYTSTSNVAGNGDAASDVYYEYDRSTDNGKNAFDGNYGFENDDNDEDCVGYVDYVFQLKAINTGDTATNLKMTDINLLYNDVTATDAQIKAFRVAIFVEDITLANPAGTVGALKTILRKSGATYFTSNYGVSANAAPSVAVTNLDANATLDTGIASNATKYYKVVVRMWLEGEDTTCNNDTYLLLNGHWTLDLAIELGTGDGAQYITSRTVAPVGAAGAVGTVTLTGTGNDTLGNDEKAVSFQWKNAADGTNATGTGADTYQFTATTTGNYYCLVTTARGTVYRTNTVALTAE